MEPDEQWYLRVALLSSIHVAEGDAAPDESILQEPSFAAALENWGREGDIAMVALEQMHASSPIGAARVRLYTRDRPTYGYLSDDIPVLAMAVSREYRGNGVGTQLLTALAGTVRDQGFSGISLSVDPDNRAQPTNTTAIPASVR